MRARFDNICEEPPIPPLSGVLPRSLRFPKRNCGVWLATWYCVPLFGSTQNDGDVWKLPDRDTSILLATVCSVSPTICTSMGEGRPKFNIWVIMSAGRNANVVDG